MGTGCGQRLLADLDRESVPGPIGWLNETPLDMAHLRVILHTPWRLHPVGYSIYVQCSDHAADRGQWVSVCWKLENKICQ